MLKGRQEPPKRLPIVLPNLWMSWSQVPPMKELARRRFVRAVVFALVFCVIRMNVAGAWTPIPFFNSDGQFMWDLETSGYPSDHVIPYLINPTIPPGYHILPEGTTEAEIVNAIRNVFQAWANVPTSKLKFRFLGIDHNARFADDGIMLVTLDFRDPGVSCDFNSFSKARGRWTGSSVK